MNTAAIVSVRMADVAQPPPPELGTNPRPPRRPFKRPGVLLDLRRRPARWAAIARTAGRDRAAADRIAETSHALGVPVALILHRWTVAYDDAESREQMARFVGSWALWWRP